MDYTSIFNAEMQGLLGNQLQRINAINKNYDLYEGKQEWATTSDLDYTPTKKITNYIKKLIDKKARFMLGREPFFNVMTVDEGATDEQTAAKETLLHNILRDNKFHSKLLKGAKDCSIGGKVAIKLWASKDSGIKIMFAPSQEFVVIYNQDDIDVIEKVIFFYAIADDVDKEKQRIKKQVWELVDGKCIVDERTYNGYGREISVEYDNFYNGLDFIPVVIAQNGGLTGETNGKSDVELLWSNQDAYNHLTSDDIDALKFQMFGQTIITDGARESLEDIKIAPGALVDLQTDAMQSDSNRQAKAERLESSFNYNDKYENAVRRVKTDMYEMLDIPDTSLELLKGNMASGKSMKAVYWDLMARCDEDWIEWRPALTQMVEYIFKMVAVYNLYNSKKVAEYETVLKIENYYPIQDDEIENRRMDLAEVQAESRSRKSYIDKWSEIEVVEEEIKQILDEKRMLEDSYDGEI